MSKRPDASVIIPTFNSGRTLSRLLDSIRRQKDCSVEIIIVDNFSTDRTSVVARQHDAKIVRLHSGMLAARRRGLELSNAPLIIFLDSDQVLARDDVISELRSKFEGGRQSLFVLEEIGIAKGLYSRLVSMNREFVQNKRMLLASLFPRAFSKTLLLEAFSQLTMKIPPEEFIAVNMHEDFLVTSEILNMKGKREIEERMGFILRALYHEEQTSLRASLRKSFLYGRNTKRLRRTPYFSQIGKRAISAFSTSIQLSSPFATVTRLLFLSLTAIPYLIGTKL